MSTLQRIAGASSAALLAAMPLASAAEAAPSPELSAVPVAAAGELCDAIHDQTDNETSAHLEEAIGKLTVKGVTVKVTILDGAKKNGIKTSKSGDKQLAQRTEDIAKKCGYAEDQNFVGITYVDFTIWETALTDNESPGKLDIYTRGTPNQELSDGEKEQIFADFGQNRRDGFEGNQEDVAEMVENIDEAMQPEEPFEWPDVNWKLVGEGTLGLAGIGGLTAFALRRRRGERLYRETFTELDSQINTLTDAIAGEDTLRAGISPQDQVFELLSREGNDVRDVVGRYQHLLEQVRAARRYGIYPDVETLKQLSIAASELGRRARREVYEYSQVRDGVAEDLRALGTRLDELSSTATAIFDTAYSDLSEKGWDVTAIKNKLNSFKSRIGTVQETSAVSQLKASEAAEPLLVEMTKYLTDVRMIEKRYAALSEEHEQRPALIENIGKRARKATQLVTAMTRLYDASCYSDLLDVPEQLADLQKNLVPQSQEIDKHINKKDVTEFELALGADAEFDATVAAIESDIARITSRAAELRTLQKTLPATLAATEKQLGGHITDATQWGIDVDEDVLAQLHKLVGSTEPLSAALKSSKPAYLSIRDQANDVSQAIASAFDTARQQHKQANDLRVGVKNGVREAKEELDALRRVLGGTYNSDTSVRLASFDIPSVDTSGDRETLQERNEALAALKEEIETAKRQAESDIASARSSDSTSYGTGGTIGGFNTFGGGFGGSHTTSNL